MWLLAQKECLRSAIRNDTTVSPPLLLFSNTGELFCAKDIKGLCFINPKLLYYDMGKAFCQHKLRFQNCSSFIENKFLFRITLGKQSHIYF